MHACTHGDRYRLTAKQPTDGELEVAHPAHDAPKDGKSFYEPHASCLLIDEGHENKGGQVIQKKVLLFDAIII